MPNNSPSVASDKHGSTQWEPASFFGGMKVSAVWIEGDQTFCFQQLMNPGPSVLSLCWQRSEIMTSSTLTRRIEAVLKIRDDLTEVFALSDPATRIRRLLEIAYKDVFEARTEAIAGLGETGPEALPQIQQLMDKPPIPCDPLMLVRALAKSAREEAGERLHKRLQLDLDYWKAIGPSLKEGWWNEDVTPRSPLHWEYGETIELIRALTQAQYRPAASTAAMLRDFWISLPQLNDPSGLDQVAQESDRLVKGLVGE